MSEKNENVHYEKFEMLFNGPRHDCNAFRIIVQKEGNKVHLFVVHEGKTEFDMLDGAYMSLDGLRYLGNVLLSLDSLWREHEIPEYSIVKPRQKG